MRLCSHLRNISGRASASTGPSSRRSWSRGACSMHASSSRSAPGNYQTTSSRGVWSPGRSSPTSRRRHCKAQTTNILIFRFVGFALHCDKMLGLLTDYVVPCVFATNHLTAAETNKPCFPAGQAGGRLHGLLPEHAAAVRPGCSCSPRWPVMLVLSIATHRRTMSSVVVPSSVVHTPASLLPAVLSCFPLDLAEFACCRCMKQCR